MTIQDDLKTILVRFTYAGISGYMTRQNYVIWDNKGFPITMAGGELKSAIKAELAKIGVPFEAHSRYRVVA